MFHKARIFLPNSNLHKKQFYRLLDDETNTKKRIKIKAFTNNVTNVFTSNFLLRVCCENSAPTHNVPYSRELVMRGWFEKARFRTSTNRDILEKVIKLYQQYGYCLKLHTWTLGCVMFQIGIAVMGLHFGDDGGFRMLQKDLLRKYSVIDSNPRIQDV